MTTLELLAPARDIECGKAAVNHGADAVYIGGPAFGARAAAGNSMADIERLALYSHRYRARVYLTLNTILFDDELENARKLAHQAWDAGVDALIIQDMGLLELDLPPLPLIASTQVNNVSADRILFLEKIGFQRVILARELSLEEIREIRKVTSIELEAFVHGSLCVCYSGQCSLSAALGGRSANRGTCGQPCRLSWTLCDGQGRAIEENRHYLSLRDMDRSASLAALIDAGVTAFKIEGRLKDDSYVKNVTAFYRERLDAIIDGDPGLKRQASGRTRFFFTPDPRKTFHRGATDYFLHGEDDGMWSPDTPKSTGEEIGAVTRCGPNWFCLSEGTDRVHPGDGLCFLDSGNELQGIQVVNVVDSCIRSHMTIPGLRTGMKVFRNRDHDFLKHLTGETSERRVELDLVFRETGEGFILEGRDEDGILASASLVCEKVVAEKPDAALDTMRKQLSRLNETIYELKSLNLETGPYFLRTAELNQLRRDLVAAMEERRRETYLRPERGPAPDPAAAYPVKELDAGFNISNAAARKFYAGHGASVLAPAFEIEHPPEGCRIMITRHCIRRCMGACLREKSHRTLPEPLFLHHAGKRFRLEFDCRECRMHVIMD